MLADLDLNLLKVFDALLEEGSVTGAADRLHLSVPATSRALGRLRRSMDDPIFVRAGRGLAPAPFALQSAPQVRALLDGARMLLSSHRAVEPAQLARTFRIRINDGVSATLASELIRRVCDEAPGVTLSFVAEGNEDAESLRNGSVDLDIGMRSESPPDLRESVLYAEEMVGFVNRKSALGRRRRPTLKQLCTQPHISASRRGRTRGPLDDALAQAGLARRVAAVVPSFLVSAITASTSDLVALVPSRFARQYAAALGAHWFPLPVELPATEISQQWHVRHDRDPAHQWLRDQVTAAAG